MDLNHTRSCWYGFDFRWHITSLEVSSSIYASSCQWIRPSSSVLFYYISHYLLHDKTFYFRRNLPWSLDTFIMFRFYRLFVSSWRYKLMLLKVWNDRGGYDVKSRRITLFARLSTVAISWNKPTLCDRYFLRKYCWFYYNLLIIENLPFQ